MFDDIASYMFSLCNYVVTEPELTSRVSDPCDEMGPCVQKDFVIVCYLVTQLCLALRPQGLQHADSPVLHYLPEFAQTRVC